jgi:hypothetical protein
MALPPQFLNNKKPKGGKKGMDDEMPTKKRGKKSPAKKCGKR